MTNSEKEKQMVKMTALYKKPADVDAFEKHYWEIHVPLNNKMPGLLKTTFSRFTSAPMGDPRFYLQCDMYFENIESLNNAMKSPEGKAAGKDLMSFASDLVTLMIGEEISSK